MLRLLFVFIFLSLYSLLFAVDTNSSIEKTKIEQKVLYLNYDYIPKRVIKGGLFFITVKILSVIPDIEDIEYTLSNAKGLEILNDATPFRKQEERYFYDTFYFRVTSTDVRLPDIKASIVDYFGISYKPTVLPGKTIEAIALNPRKNFSNIIAKDFKIKHYKTTTYDDLHSIVVFVAEAKQTFLADFHLNGVKSQGFESLSDSIESSRMIYYVVLDKKEENFLFSYFNMIKNDYIELNIPIIVEDDSVTTQSDLKPKDQSKQRLKIFIALGVVFFGVVMLLWRQRYIYIAFILLPAIYVIYLLIPQEQICIRENSTIRILPLQNSTVFEITQKRICLDKTGETKNFVKVELSNNKIGWVKNEDLCSY